jgi:hypothetical protein
MNAAKINLDRSRGAFGTLYQPHVTLKLEQNNRKLINLHNNGEDDKYAHGLADF